MKYSKYKISYKKSVAKDFKKIDPIRKKGIINKIESQLSDDPHKGKQLKGKYKGFWSIRLGTQRAIYKISKEDVVIIAVGHRKEVYKRIPVV